MSKLPTSRLPITPSKTTATAKSGLRPPQASSANASSTQQVSPTGGDSSANSFAIGDRVTANGKSGTVAFIGSTKFAEGEWIGVILDEAQGKNDGSYEGTRYFETEPNRGLFCRPAKVQRLAQNGASGELSTPVKPQETPATEPIESSTSSTSQEKSVASDADTTLTNTSAADTTTNNQAALTEPILPKELHVGDRVVVSGTKFGTLKYLGKIHVAEGMWCGIQLDEPSGKNDGSVSGKRYFTCQQRYGLFSPLARVEKVTGEMTQSQINKRKDSIASSTNNNRPLHRSTSQESLQSNLSEFSTSSNSISRIPTRTPARPQQQKVPTNTNLYTTPNTKSLLTQAAATLAAVTPSSNQLTNLVQTIKDKDVFIEKLQSQREQDRLEFSRAAQQVDEMESRMLSFKQQYDAKELENEQLKKEQYQTQQRIEDLEFQLEEYKLTDANKEQSSSATVPEGHRVFSPKDIEIYEQIKEKVLELETVNQKLVLEKQTIQDEHRQELKRLNESNENDYKTRFHDLEKKFTEELQTKQNDKLDFETKLNEKDQEMKNLLEQVRREKQEEIDHLKSQITALQTNEQSQKSTLSEKETLYEQTSKEIKQLQSQLTTLQQAKDANEKQINELLNELKRHQENIVPDLQKECQTLKLELENRDRTANLAVNERESHYEQQIKEYQTNLTQATNETEKMRNELKQIQEESAAKEKQMNELIDSLKQDHEKLQKQEHQSTAKLADRESQFDAQIKEYQSKLNQSTDQIQTMQSELSKLQEEKLSNEKKYTDTINTLKQDHERQYASLKTELTELQDRDRTQNMALNERETHYEAQIKEYQTKRDQAVREGQDLRNELTKLQEDKTSIEQKFNDEIKALKQDFEKQIQSFKTQISELESQNNVKTNEFHEKDQQINNLQSRLEQISKDNTELHQQIEHKQHEYETKLNQLQNEFDNKVQTQNQQANSSMESITKEYEQSRNSNETLKKDLQELQSKYHDLQTEYQKHLTSNEQLKNTSDNIVNEKQALIDQLTKQLNEMQQVQSELIEKQMKQHAEFERQRTEESHNFEKILKEKAEEYENQIVLIKSQFRVETENSNLDHEQEKLRLKTQLQQAIQANSGNATSPTTNSHAKQLEYELTEARYQIEKLQKQIEANSTKDDRSTLESQINFLNDVIVDLRNTNESLKKELEFQRNPYVGDEEYVQSTTTHIRSSAPRLYCDMCEVFDQHDTDDCPKQSSLVDEQSHGDRERVLPPARVYCEKCEEFDHDCNEGDETY